ncbi:hypothetical protein ACFYY1_42175 [Streptomyces sp. NPDC001890]|uniref:hypothetical protein n=1 Tax=Streptomyces sp. NPDC001890 TaxID=3364620 RepID=UPI0036915A0B
MTFTRRRTRVKGTWINEHLPLHPGRSPVYAVDPQLTRTTMDANWPHTALEAEFRRRLADAETDRRAELAAIAARAQPVCDTWICRLPALGNLAPHRAPRAAAGQQSGATGPAAQQPG